MKHEDTKTEEAVAAFRKTGRLPERVTLRFLGLCSKRDLSRMAVDFRQRIQRVESAGSDQQLKGIRRRLRARESRVESERRQRGYIQ